MAKYKNSITYSGILKYNDSAEYELCFRNKKINISNIIDQVYHSPNNFIEIKIMNCCKLIFEEQGKLYMRKDQFGINCYHISGCNLDYTLFQMVDEVLDITIYAEILKQGDKFRYGTEQTTNQVVV